jgi:hypothetical protein
MHGFGDQIGDGDLGGQCVAGLHQDLEDISRPAAEVEQPISRLKIKSLDLVSHQLLIVIGHGHDVETE